MITNLKVTSLSNTQIPPLEFSMFDSGDYLVRNIEGLTPPKNTLFTTSAAPSDGAIYQDSNAESRQIILTLGFETLYGNNIESLRRGLYLHFPYKSMLRLEFHDTNYGKVYIDGVVELHEANIFSNEPLSQITIECPNPLFKSVDITEHQWTTNSSGNITRGSQTEINITGTAPTPITLEFKLASTVSNLSHLHVELYSRKGGRLSGFRLSGIPTHIRPDGGSRVIYRSCITERTLHSVETNGMFYFLLPYINKNENDWIELQPGISRFNLTSSVQGSPPSGVGVATITYRERYSGL